MADKERESNGYGGFVGSDGQPVDLKIENGFAAATDYKQILHHNSVGSSSNTLRTYKRRKKNHTHDEKVSESLHVQVNDKFNNEISHMDMGKLSTQTENIANIGAYNIIHASDEALVKQKRNYCLQQMLTSLEGGNGLRECIQDALVLRSESGCSHVVKESNHSCEDLGKCAALSSSGPHQTAPGISNVTFSASKNIIDDRRVTKLCQHAFFDVITSEKFALMCHVVESFGGAKAHKFFDIAGIDSRMKEGVYETSPVLFLSDTEQLWMNLRKVGSDIVSIANCLLQTSRAAYHQQFATEASDMHAKVEQTETKGAYKIRTCKCCKENADVRDSLVCDSCEEMYHVSCIKPAVKEIPSRSWYCASCTRKGIESPHADCVVCERLNASRLLGNTDAVDQHISDDDLEESSNGLAENDVLQLSKGKTMHCCKVCKTEVQSSEDLRICGHAFCPHKFYHARCLNKKQFNCFGPLWYCPSCLCRACFIDCDDEKIVLCDACDDAYHIYCMEPPRTMIPRGKWYCSKCDSELRRLREAKRTYENLQMRRLSNNLPEHRKVSHEDSSVSGVNGKDKEEAMENSVAVDMLLKAATTLNNEENLADTDIKKL